MTPLLPARQEGDRVEAARLERARVENRYRHLVGKINRSRFGNGREKAVYEAQCLAWLHQLLGQAIDGRKVPRLAPRTTSRHVLRAVNVLSQFPTDTKDPLWLKPPRRSARTTHQGRRSYQALRRRAANAAQQSNPPAVQSTPAAA